jgi:hypothetical protein
MDDLRRVPPPFPPLALRERGNFISVRQKPDQDAGWGTLNNPKRFELPLLTPHLLRSTLGYEAEPASEFWQFSVSGRVRLQVNRISDDRYASCVGVALLDQNNRRVAPLVQSAGGRGEPVEIGPGLYKVCASLGIAERLKDLRLEFIATPVGGALRSGSEPVGRMTATGALASDAQLLGVASAGAGGVASLAAGVGPAAQHPPRLRRRLSAASVLSQAGCCGTARVSAEAAGTCVSRPVAPLQGVAHLNAQAAGTIRTLRWCNQPLQNWQCRLAADGVIELNGDVIRLEGPDAAARRQALLQLLHTLVVRT